MKPNQRLAVFLIIAAAVIAYASSFTGIFIFDDYSITHNPYLRHLWPPWEALAMPPNITLSARPIVSWTFAVNYAISGLNVWSYHAFNLLFHIVCALLLCGIIRRTLSRLNSNSASNLRTPVWLAASVALIWVVHPLNTDAVTYIIQRTDLLMGMFLLLTLYCVIRGVESERPRWWFVGAVVACAFGMGSKETMAVAPLVILSYDRIFLVPSFHQIVRQRWRVYLGLASTWLILAVLLATHPHGESSGFGFPDLTPLDYARTQLGVLAYYLRLSFVPHPLVLDYADWPVAHSLASVWPQAILIFGLLTATIWALWKKPALGFLGLWFFLILAPTSSVLPLRYECAAERRMYLPLAAVIMAIVLAAQRLVLFFPDRIGSGKRWFSFAPFFLVAVVVVALGALTFARNRDFQNAITMWQRAVVARPFNVRARTNLANALNGADRTIEAIDQYKIALQQRPNFASAHTSIGAVLLRKGELNEAVNHLQEAIRIETPRNNDYRNLANAHYNLGSAFMAMHRENEAFEEYRTAVRLNPGSAIACNRLGSLLGRRKQFQEAVRLHQQAVDLEPDNPQFQHDLAFALAKRGDMNAAITKYNEALRLNPGYLDARVNLGVTLHAIGKDDEAIAQFRAALRIAPHDAETNYNLGVLLGSRGKVGEAIQFFSEAATIRAKTKHFSLAAEATEKALELAKTSDDTSLVLELQKRLEAHRAAETSEPASVKDK